MKEPGLVIRGLDKSFAAPVLRGIDMEVAPGEIHALVGENGAGKTTLVNILAGNLERDAGTLNLDGNEYHPANPAAAFAAGVSCAAQEMSSIDTLTVAENISLRSLPTKGMLIDRKRLHRTAAGLMNFVGMSGIDSDTEAGNLSIADRQLLEIARAIGSECRLLILDEPTAALTAPQADRLHEILRELANKDVSIIYISHRLQDVLDIADVVSVLRDGRIVASGAAGRFTVATLVQSMTGQTSFGTEQRDAPAHAGEPVLELRQVTTGVFAQPLNFSCAAGEAVGIAGLAGSGRTAFLNTLFGLAPIQSGQVVRHSREKSTAIVDASQAVAAGIGYLGEDRRSVGIYSGQSVLMNMAVPGAEGSRSPLSIINRAREKTAAERLTNQLDIRYASLHQDIDELSGGNQQKTLLARWLMRDVDVLLLDEPTRGIDIATKFAIYEFLAQLRMRGKSIVIASSETEELMLVCDRIDVVSNREFVSSYPRAAFSEEDILAAAFSNYQSATSASRSMSEAKS